MGHGKLRKFAENETFPCLLQPSAEDVLSKGYANLSDHRVKGRWVEEMFGGHPGEIVLELGCGKGEYTLELARRNPDKNYIGVDIKGARLWSGAKTATAEGLRNVAFLRTRIEFITAFFAPGEVSEIWLTFSDPQLKASPNKRLSSPVFLERYRQFLRRDGIIHLKTDSRFLFEYTKAVALVNGLPVLAETPDLYSDGASPAFTSPVCTTSSATSPASAGSAPEFSLRAGQRAEPCPAGGARLCIARPEKACAPPDLSSSGTSDVFAAEVREVKTFYESMFLEMGLPICYMEFLPWKDGPYLNPRDPEDFDSARWRELEGPRRTFNHQ